MAIEEKVSTMKTGLAAAAMLAISALPAYANGACLPHVDAVASLKQKYGEEKVGLGIGPGGNAVFGLYVAETGTWTLLVTRTDRLSCIAASGDNWMPNPIIGGLSVNGQSFPNNNYKIENIKYYPSKLE